VDTSSISIDAMVIFLKSIPSNIADQ
jgi:hypothetical protein